MTEIINATHEMLSEILALQKLCYLSEAEIYNNYLIPPLVQTLNEIEIEYKKCNAFLAGLYVGNIVASVRGYIQDNAGYIGKLIVHPANQNQGIGKLMLQKIEQSLPACAYYELFTGSESHKNITLYKKCGYSVIDKRTAGNNSPAMVVMRKYT